MMKDVRLMYESPSECPSLIEKYGAEYIFVGSVENDRYAVNLPSDGLKEIFNVDSAVIYQKTN